MISQRKANNVKKLLKEGRSQREIYQQLGVSRSAISEVKNGRWDARQKKLQESIEVSDYRYPSLEGGISGRCPDCGAPVYLPCHACWVRRQIAWEKKRKQF